jgi:hypothetical protein
VLAVEEQVARGEDLDRTGAGADGAVDLGARLDQRAVLALLVEGQHLLAIEIDEARAHAATDVDEVLMLEEPMRGLDVEVDHARIEPARAQEALQRRQRKIGLRRIGEGRMDEQALHERPLMVVVGTQARSGNGSR